MAVKKKPAVNKNLMVVSINQLKLTGPAFGNERSPSLLHELRYFYTVRTQNSLFPEASMKADMTLLIRHEIAKLSLRAAPGVFAIAVISFSSAI